jgi:hypothetical protein
VPLLLLQKFWQQDWWTWDLHWSQANWKLHSFLHFSATMAVQLALHDPQSLHKGFFLGCPWEDMTSTARAAKAAAALRPAAPETIVVDG